MRELNENKRQETLCQKRSFVLGGFLRSTSGTMARVTDLIGDINVDIDSTVVKKEDLRPTCVELLRELSPDSDGVFLDRFNRMYYDLGALEDCAYSTDDPSITLLQTMVCLFRISELQSGDTVDLEISIPIIVYLQDKESYHNAHLHSLYALQNTDFSDHGLLQNENENHIKIRMLYECHAENLYHLSHYRLVTQCTSQFLFKFDHIPDLCTSYRVHHLSFFAHIQLKQFDAAFADISRAIALTPDSATLYNHRCFVLCEMGQFERALEDANKCLEIDPDHQIGLNNRGSVYNDLKRYDLALCDLDRAIQVSDGQSANAYRHRAFAHYMLHHWDMAIDDVNTAVSMNEDYPEAEELKTKIWADIWNSARLGIDEYVERTDLMFLESMVRLITDFVVGTKETHSGHANDGLETSEIMKNE